jgi:excinuclease UvrABC ATPase subunit
VETFSPYTRQFFERMDKPKVDAIHGIPPAIAIEQVNNMRSTRSTVGTITEINDYLKMLFPRLAEGDLPECQTARETGDGGKHPARAAAATMRANRRSWGFPSLCRKHADPVDFLPSSKPGLPAHLDLW